MNFLVFLSTYILPFFIFYVVAYGLWKGRNVYQAFVEGAKGGFHTALGILPTLVGLLAAVGVLRASGFLDLISGLLKTLLKGTGFPAELLPLVIVRLFSNSAATGLALDLFKAHGPDSTQGLLASLFLSSTETVFYTMSIYFMSVKIKKTRYTLPGAPEPWRGLWRVWCWYRLYSDNLDVFSAESNAVFDDIFYACIKKRNIIMRLFNLQDSFLGQVFKLFRRGLFYCF